MAEMLRFAVLVCVLGLAAATPALKKTREEIEAFRSYLEGTRTKHGVVIGNPKGNIWENSGKYQGDILLDDAQVESLVEQFSAGRNAYIWPGALWPDNTVVYEFAAGQFTEAQRNYVLYTMGTLEQFTCIRFRPRNPGERNYALITTYDDGCYASVGYWWDRGIHTINLGRDNPGHGCFDPIVIIHEWLHVIGFFHMHSTHDRDNYVRINWENIIRGLEYAFERYDSNLVSNLGLPYEYDSCMHYSGYAFSSNGRTTIDALRPHDGGMGHLEYVTGNDFFRVDRLYGCAAWKKPEDYKDFYFDKSPSDVLPEKVHVAELPVQEQN